MQTHNAMFGRRRLIGGPKNARRGTLLIIVLVTIVILSLSAYTFTALMQTEEEASRLVTRQIQSKYLAESGVDYVRLYLSNSNATIRERGGRWDNADVFQAVPVAINQVDPNQIGYFSVATSNLDEDGTPEGFRFGLVDESSKINLNTLPYSDVLFPGSGREILMALPDMTEEIADSILDWLDADDDEREFGTESTFYNGQSPPYDTKNGPMDSLDELLLIRGVTPQLLFGLDDNRNGLLDPDESATADVSLSEADAHLGWANYLTLYSNESNLNGEGLPRININASDLEQLYDDLKSVFNDDWANFIIYYRCAESPPLLEQPGGQDGELETVGASAVPIDFSRLESRRRFETIVDLVGTFIDVSEFVDSENENGDDGPTIIESPLQAENLPFTIPNLMANLTTYEGATIPGRINIMQAPRRVLDAIPGLDEDTVDQLVSRRGSDFELDDPTGADLNRQYETWLLVEGLVDLETMKSLMSFICTGGDVYRAEIVGYFANGAGTSRSEAIFDTTVPVPRILFWRDKSHLSGNFSIDVLGTQIFD